MANFNYSNTSNQISNEHSPNPQQKINEALPHPVSARHSEEYRNNLQKSEASPIMQSLNNGNPRPDTLRPQLLSKEEIQKNTATLTNTYSSVKTLTSEEAQRLPYTREGALLREEFGDTATINQICSEEYRRLRRNVANHIMGHSFNLQGHDDFKKKCDSIREISGRHMNLALDLISNPDLVMSKIDGHIRMNEFLEEVKSPTLKSAIENYIKSGDYTSVERLKIAHDIIQYTEEQFTSMMEEARKELGYRRSANPNDKVIFSTDLRGRILEIYNNLSAPNEYK